MRKIRRYGSAARFKFMPKSVGQQLWESRVLPKTPLLFKRPVTDPEADGGHFPDKLELYKPQRAVVRQRGGILGLMLALASGLGIRRR